MVPPYRPTLHQLFGNSVKPNPEEQNPYLHVERQDGETAVYQFDEVVDTRIHPVDPGIP